RNSHKLIQVVEVAEQRAQRGPVTTRAGPAKVLTLGPHQACASIQVQWGDLMLDPPAPRKVAGGTSATKSDDAEEGAERPSRESPPAGRLGTNHRPVTRTMRKVALPDIMRS